MLQSWHVVRCNRSKLEVVDIKGEGRANRGAREVAHVDQLYDSWIQEHMNYSSDSTGPPR